MQRKIEKSSQSNPEPMHSELYKCFYDFFYFYEKNRQDADFFAQKIEKLFCETGIHNLVTFCINLDDGIGDYTSQVYFIEKLNKILQEIPNATLRNISIISDLKLKVSKFVRESKIAEESVTILDNQSDSLDFKSYQNIIGTPKTALQKEKLQRLIQEASFLFNLALPLVHTNDKLYPGYQYNFKPCEEFEIEIPAKEVFIESWRAYQFKELLNEETAIEYPDLPAFTESFMGMHEDQKGLRFIEKIFSAEKHKLTRFLNKKFLDAMDIQDNKSFQIYTKNNSFAIGYLQDKTASIGFVNLACQMSPKEGDMNVLINLEFFNQIENQTTWIENLRALGFTQIHIPGLDQRINLNKTEKKSRILRLLDFKGISEADKNQFYGLAEMISASGDNSLSDLISAGVASNSAIPFVQPYLTSRDSCLLSILCEIARSQHLTQEDHTELMNYIKYLYFNVRIENLADGNSIRFEYNVDEINEFKENRQKIADSWHKFCCFLYDNRNAKNNFNDLMVRYTFHHLLKNNCIDECLKMAEMLPIDALIKISPFHLAVKLNKIDFVKKLIESESTHLNKLIRDRFSALEIARYYGHSELAGLLITHWPNRHAELSPFMSSGGFIDLLRDLPENCRYEIASEFNKLIKTFEDCELVLLEIPKKHRWDFIHNLSLYYCESPAVFKLILENDCGLEFLSQFLDETIKEKRVFLATRILKEMPLNLRFGFAFKMRDITELYHLDELLKVLPPDCHLNFINETLGKKRLGGSLQLARFLSYLPVDIRFDYCSESMALIDNDYWVCEGDYGCALILSELPEDRRLEFALKIRDKINTSDQLQNILSLLPEPDRLQFPLSHVDIMPGLADSLVKRGLFSKTSLSEELNQANLLSSESTLRA